MGKLKWSARIDNAGWSYWLSGNDGTSFEILEQWEVFSADADGNYTEEWDGYACATFDAAILELIDEIKKCPDLVQKNNWLWVSPYGYAIALDYLCYVGDYQENYEHSLANAVAWFEKNYG